jgi:thiamine pyrophosphate-dependent acetolactate synthase large subunit-like protein
MRIFDAPTRERCVMRRARTNTPLQALVTLNDPQFLEAARFLAQRMIQNADNLPARITYAYELVMSRPPEPWEVKLFKDSFATMITKYRADPASAKAMLSVGEAKRDPAIDAAEHAAWMVIASMILNTDEALTKG